jgi:hypothetical protein
LCFSIFLSIRIQPVDIFISHWLIFSFQIAFSSSVIYAWFHATSFELLRYQSLLSPPSHFSHFISPPFIDTYFHLFRLVSPPLPLRFQMLSWLRLRFHAAISDYWLFLRESHFSLRRITPFQIFSLPLSSPPLRFILYFSSLIIAFYFI